MEDDKIIERARVAFLVNAILSVLAQVSLYYTAEFWRRRKYPKVPFYHTHFSLLIYYGIAQSVIISYYIYRYIYGIDHDHALLIYEQTSIMLSLAIVFCVLGFMDESMRGIGINIASMAHLCALSALVIWLEDTFAIAASIAAVVNTSLTPPRTYTVRPQ